MAFMGCDKVNTPIKVSLFLQGHLYCNRENFALSRMFVNGGFGFKQSRRKVDIEKQEKEAHLDAIFNDGFHQHPCL
ncbi:MAG: hypothetical protein PWQ08_210 [Clostridiales bacterium]|jgi:hypothetical protein|nr:hypothetical protein [Clostridiales bacterium]